MDLFQNPFHILKATPRDNKKRIYALANEGILLLNPDDCIEARSDLTTPRKRLSAEIAWFPGLSPKNAEKVLAWLSKPVQTILSSNTLNFLSPMARANTLASGLQKLTVHNRELVTKWILMLAWTFEHIDPGELCVVINEDHSISGFREVVDLSDVEADIQERRQHFKQIIKTALGNLSAIERIKAVTETVDSATKNGEAEGPVLIHDMVDGYEIDNRVFLEEEEANIGKIVEMIRNAADDKYSYLKEAIDRLIKVVKRWDIVAQPIQVSMKSRGLDHAASHRNANLVRGLAIHFFNEHGEIDLSQRLTKMLQEVFAEVGAVADITTKDASILEENAEQRSRLIAAARRRTEEWRKEITYEANVGTIFKNKLRISPKGIEWKGRRWDLSSISRVRWGGTRHSLNGIPTGTTYNIVFGNASSYASINLKKEAIYNDFIARLWKTVCVRLLTEYLEGLKAGKKYEFGSAILSDFGIELEPNAWITRNKVFCRWNDLTIWNGPGVFCIGKKKEKNLAATFSYKDKDNIHILEAAIRMLWKKGCKRLSSVLEKEE